MKKIAMLLSFLLVSASALADETIVFVRHAEKPEQGLGQLSSLGLQRSLALPEVLSQKFGQPDVIFAPDPSRLKNDHGTQYYYVRPLATIEPTAIHAGLPVNLAFGYKDIDGMKSTLLSDEYRDATIFVAWEHRWEEKLVKALVGGIDPQEAKQIPVWQGNDFDSIYVVRIARDEQATHVAFLHDQQGLN